MDKKLEKHVLRVKWLNVFRLMMTGLSLGLLMLTPAFNEFANKTRVEPGYGGECIIFLIPLLFMLWTLDL